MVTPFTNGTKGKHMQDYINELLSTLSRIEENHANLMSDANRFFKTHLREVWNRTEVDVVNIVWIKWLGDT